MLCRVLSLILAALLAGAASAAPLYDSGEIQVTGGSQDVQNQSNDVRNITSADGRYYISYAATAEGGAFPFANIWVKRWSPGYGFDTEIKVFDRTDATGDPFHDITAIGVSGGTLVITNSDAINTADASNATGDDFDYNLSAGIASCVVSDLKSPPYVRTAPLKSFLDTATWTPSTSTPSGQNMCATASWNFGASLSTDTQVFQDAYPLELANGDLWLSYEGGRMTSGYAGVDRAIAKRAANGTWTGPYVFLNGGTYDSTGCPSGSSAVNVFAKTSFRERTINGVATMFAVASPRINFDNSTAYGSWEIYAYKSVDGGATWTDITGGNSFTPGTCAASPSTPSQACVPFVRDSDYLIYTGDHDQGTQFDVDEQGRIHLLIRPFRSGTASYCNGQANVADSGNAYSLVLYRQTTAGVNTFTTTSLDTTDDFQAKQPFMWIDAENNFYVVRPGGSGFTVPDGGMAYKESTDGGATFGSWTALTQAINSGGELTRTDRLAVWRDPDRRRVAFTYYNSVTDELFFRILQTAEDRVCCAD